MQTPTSDEKKKTTANHYAEAYDKLCAKEEACKDLGGIGFTKFYALLKNGDLRAVKMGNRTMVRRSEINRYLSTLQPYQSENAGR
jgi:excisionase family DNA binding protein